LLLSRKEKEALVIKHAKECKTYREIAKIVHISPSEIKKILDKVAGDSESSQNNKEKQQQKLSLPIPKLFKCSEKTKA
jgi:transposase